MTRYQKQTLEMLRSDDFSAYISKSFPDGVISVAMNQGVESVLINQLGEIVS
jgi:hypothetical protein